MKKGSLVVFFLCFLAGCSGRTQHFLCPRHIETPGFPPLARTVHVTGKITLTVTIGANGDVTNVDATADNPLQQAHPLLQKFAVENMKRWTFTKPPSAPYSQTMIYDYEFDPSLPGEGGPSSLPPITKVDFDLPDRVTILANMSFIETSHQ
jgi:TonB-like protein